MRPVVHRSLQRMGDDLAQRLQGHEPWLDAVSGGMLHARLRPRGPVVADVAWRSHATLHARSGTAFAIPMTDQARAAGNPGLHPAELVRVRYTRNQRIYGGLYRAADMARSRSLREIPTQWLLANQFRLHPNVLRARIDRRLPQYLARITRKITRHLDPWA